LSWSAGTVPAVIKDSRTLQARIVSGSFVLLAGSSLATGINFAYNIAVARFLGPAGFGHATVVYTLLILISAVTLSFQIVAAKLVAQQTSLECQAAAYRALHRGAWACGILVAVALLIFRVPIAEYLKLPSPVLISLLAIGAAFYVPLGSRRGFIQGTCRFQFLATNLVLEGAVRLGGSLFLILAGLGVPGVIAANAAAIAVAYLSAASRLERPVPNPVRLPDGIREVLQGIVFFSGQMLINNCDIVLVKHFFVPSLAGLYAAVAMVGRVIFAFSSAVVNSMFPLVAGTKGEERRNLKVIATSLLLVLGVGAILALGLRIAPASIWTTFFGADFALAGKHGLPYLLALYAITTVIYSLSVIIITYEMSYKIANTSWVQLAFSGVVIAGICRFHSSLQQVIIVQLVLMVVLLVVVALPFLLDSIKHSKRRHTARSGPIRIIRRVAEDEVIAEFLRRDFENPAFRDYHDSLRDIVMKPNLEDAAENAKRRALLYIRHLSLWKELPAGTEWYEAEIRETGLDQIRAFPRAHWRKLARGNYSVTEVAERIRRQEKVIDPGFLAKINAIRDRLTGEEDAFVGAVVLIGLNESEPLTILDGNHRLVAAMLASPSRVQTLRFLCGLSPRMTQCCWYKTNLATLVRYGTNLLMQLVRDPEAELERLLESSG
jgi:O-antigen/teichoic acid export membrane protein